MLGLRAKGSQGMSDRKLLGVGLAGSALAAECCFTPPSRCCWGPSACRPGSPGSTTSSTRRSFCFSRSQDERSCGSGKLDRAPIHHPCPHCSHAQPEMMPTDVCHSSTTAKAVACCFDRSPAHAACSGPMAPCPVGRCRRRARDDSCRSPSDAVIGVGIRRPLEPRGD
jgi:hypothetical protein